MPFKASANPGSFDLYEQWSDSIKLLWMADAIQPIEIQKLKYWQEINNLSKSGRLTEHDPISQGDAPHRIKSFMCR